MEIPTHPPREDRARRIGRLIAAALAITFAVVAAVAVYRAVADVGAALRGPTVREPTPAERAELKGRGTLAFARLVTRGAGNDWVVFVADGDGSRARRLVAGRSPAWSPDGRTIAFERGSEVWVADADGRHARRVTDFGSNPAWSPDGRTIAFDRGSLVGISVIRANGRGLRQLTGEGDRPAWSADGRRIAFISERDGVEQDGLFGPTTVGQVYVMNADGTEQRRLSHTGTADGSPAWAPEGTRIAFSSRSDELLTTKEGLVITDAEGGDTKRRFVEAFDTEPAWSPDGSWIAVVCENDLRTELCAVRAERGGDLLRLAPLGGGMGASPTWRAA